MNKQRSARECRAGEGLITRVADADAEIFFTVAIQLRAGNITAAGVGSTDPQKNLVVTGGTGSFLWAWDRVHLVEYRHDTGSLRILFRWLRRHASQTPSAEQGAPLGVSSVPARTNLDSSP